jgi:cbb3-type cytochrome oxidase subunit 3
MTPLLLIALVLLVFAYRTEQKKPRDYERREMTFDVEHLEYCNNVD